MDNNGKVKKKKKSPVAFMIFILVAFALCLGVNYALSYGNRMETMIVRNGVEEDFINVEGFVFREQTVIRTPEAGYVFCVADEDQRVKTGEEIVYIYKNEINVQANRELEDVERQIKKISEKQAVGLTENDIAKIEQGILDIVREVPRMGNELDFDRLMTAKNDVDDLIKQKRIAKGLIEPEKEVGEAEALKKRKAELEAQYNIERKVVYAPKSGAFTSRIDGMEESLNLPALEKISVDYIENLKKSDIKNMTTGQVEKDAPVGKIVGNYSWSVAFVVPSTFVEDMKTGNTVDVRFTDISVDAVQGTVKKIIDEKDGKAVVVVESGEFIESITSTSKANIQIIKSRHEGFRIPAESIRMVDGKTGVYIVKNSKSRFVPVKILYNNKEWVIVAKQNDDGEKTIKLYDELIISGKNLYDNKVVR
ncbi:MAG: hypothetical protein IJN96_06185 [Clostridia bacterium]|nr:hypothetical protein [Clostridia bacterium]